MFTKDSKVKEDDLVLVETKPLKEKCGLAVWRNMTKREY